ncbi:MAG: rsbT co-antagonist protein RsbR [Clostridia bacterium]|nr:rsbT co-antagonist protein RsbR [Clostridia bacterium]
MVKDSIIYNLETLLEGLALDENKREKWEEFLVSFAEAYDSENLKEKIKEPLKNILQYVDESSLIKGVEFLNQKVNNFPIADILKAIIEATGEIRKEKEDIINELNEIISELATPVISIWKDILLVPLIGTLDSDRAQSMAERVLNRAADTNAKMVILDVTGVPMIDTFVGGYLIEVYKALKLLGSEVVLTGIKPEIAHTLVKLGVNFDLITVKRNLESALKYCISATAERESDNRNRVVSDRT